MKNSEAELLFCKMTNITYLYLDESGDLGFNFINKKPSKYFIISCVKIDNEETNNKFKRIIKKIRRRKLKKKYKQKPELKFTNSSLHIREAILKEVAKSDIEIYTILINKFKTKQDLRSIPTLLYKYIIRILFEHAFRELTCNKLVMHMDRILSSSDRENFKEYILMMHDHLLKNIPKIEFFHENSVRNPGLQTIDFIVGAFGYKYEKEQREDNLQYYNIIKEKIKLEKKLF